MTLALAAALLASAAFAQPAGKPPPLPGIADVGGSAGGGRFVSIAALSAHARAAMAAEPERPGDRAARRAREAAIDQALAGLGRIVTRGRVERRGWLREWRGEAQSVFAVRCDRFAERGGRQALEALQGQDATIAGAVTGVSGRLVTLGDCRLLPAGLALPPGSGLQEAGGLEPRPPTAAEANAGPGRGIAAAAIDRVLYTARFQTRLDGLGNMYTDRDERVYVLLRDGAGYRHEWSFPFTDLDVALSRRREPGRWLRWRQEGEAVVLEDAEGQRIGLDQPRTMLPLPAGARFEHGYYLLHVGQGGLRRDRSYAFRADGSVTLGANSLVAANLGPNGFLAVTRPGTSNAARYAFDGFALTLTDAEGRSERRFVAQFAPAPEAGAPDSLILGGEVYWTRREGSGGGRSK
jgi:hypothetical protein